MESDGIWWAVTIAEALAATFAVACMIPELRKKNEIKE